MKKSSRVFLILAVGMLSSVAILGAYFLQRYMIHYETFFGVAISVLVKGTFPVYAVALFPALGCWWPRREEAYVTFWDCYGHFFLIASLIWTIFFSAGTYLLVSATLDLL